MKKALLSMVLCFAVLSVATLAFAQDVYVTKRGKKYHQEACLLIKNKNAQKTTLEEAQAKGLKPCGKCFKAEQVSALTPKE